jgi:glycosyltransferase involved in cell wall biosynthesis
MNILMISTDRSIFDEGSSVQSRLLEQGSLVTHLHVVVLTPRSGVFTQTKIGKHVTVYPTLSAGRLAYVVDAYRIGGEILRHARKDAKWLITTQDPFELGAVGYMLARKFHFPLHLQLHTDPWSAVWRKGHPLNRLRFALAVFLLRKADGVRVVSERVERSVRSLGVPDTRITKIPIYVDVMHFMNVKPAFDLHRAYSNFTHVVLSIGRLQPEKNYAGLIRAFAQVHKAHEDTLLLIVGSGPERERLIFLARSLELDACVKILPWARDVAAYYKTCDVYVQPSLYEGWGLAVVEAMAGGAPVVMTDVGCAGEIVRSEETGLVVPVADEKALAYAIDRLLGNREFALNLAANGNAAVQKLATKAETLMLYKTSWEQALAHGNQKSKNENT